MRNGFRFSLCVLLGAAVLAAACKKSEPGGAAPSSAAPGETSAPPPSPVPAAPTKEVFDSPLGSLEVEHSAFDMGKIQNLFDGDPETIVRTANANPAVFDISFRKPVALKGVGVTTTDLDMGLVARVTPEAGEAKTYNKEFRNLPHNPTVRLDFDGFVGSAKALHLEIKNLNGGDGHIHIRDIKFLTGQSAAEPPAGKRRPRPLRR